MNFEIHKNEKISENNESVEKNKQKEAQAEQKEENSAIFEEIDTNINHEIITGFSAERKLPIVKKVKEGDLVEMYGKKYLVLGFTHSSEKKEDIYRFKEIAHAKKVSEKEALKIAERKTKLDEVLKFSNLFAEYNKLSSESYHIKIDKKAEIKKLIVEIQGKIDTDFLSKLGEIKNLILSPDQKRSLIYLLNNYNRAYLYQKNPYNYLTSKGRAMAVELVSSLVTEGADIMSVGEKEKLDALNQKSLSEKNLNSGEMKELACLKRKDERIEKLLKPENWRELNYESFNPQLEIRRIRHFGENEISNLSPSERLNIEKERLASYKKNLLEQKNKIAEIQMDIEKTIKRNPDANMSELMDEVYLKAGGAKMTGYQIEAFRNGIEEYVKRHQAVENYRKKYPDDKTLFAACFGRTPEGDIEVIKGPMTLYFRCHDLEDYALIHEQKFSQGEEVINADKDRANLSAGVSVHKCNICDLENCIIAEKSLGQPLREDTYIHEEQHKIKKLFKDEAMEQNLMNAMEKAPINEKTKILADYLRVKREDFENRAKDEILAYFKDGTDLGELKKIMLQTREQEGLYDYYGEWYVKEGVNEKMNLIKGGADELFVNTQFVKIFRNEYKMEIINPAIESIWYLKNQGWTKEKILNLMINEPLARWPKLVKRIEEDNEEI